MPKWLYVQVNGEVPQTAHNQVQCMWLGACLSVKKGLKWMVRRHPIASSAPVASGWLSKLGLGFRGKGDLDARLNIPLTFFLPTNLHCMRLRGVCGASPDSCHPPVTTSRVNFYYRCEAKHRTGAMLRPLSTAYCSLSGEKLAGNRKTAQLHTFAALQLQV